MHEREASAHNLRFVYRPIDLLELQLPATAVGQLLQAGIQLGFNAFNVTHPCKQLVLETLDEIDPAALRLGACNTVLIEDGKLIGYNTDRSGFASALAMELPDADLTDVVLLGAGGAGSAVADALIGAGTQRLSIIDPEPQRAAALADTVQHAAASSVQIRAGSPADATRWLPEATGLVNASPIGMFSHPGLPTDITLLHADMWVADIVYRPAITELIDRAAAVGCAVMPGKAMAVGQAADTFELVTGLVPDRQRMYAHLNELVQLEDHKHLTEKL